MILEGRVFKSGKLWVAEIPALDASTQGHSRTDLLEMVQDLVKELLESKQAKIGVAYVKGELYVEVRPSSELLPVILKRQRMKQGLTIRQVAARLGYKNHNAYAAYEQGKSIPSYDKFEELLVGILAPENISDRASLGLRVA